MDYALFNWYERCPRPGAVPKQLLQARPIVCGNAGRAVQGEPPGVIPAEHLAGRVLLEELLSAEPPEDPSSDRLLEDLDVGPGGEVAPDPPLPERALLAFGPERRELREATLRRAERRLRLPMRGEVSSLNLATSVAAALYGRGDAADPVEPV